MAEAGEPGDAIAFDGPPRRLLRVGRGEAQAIEAVDLPEALEPHVPPRHAPIRRHRDAARTRLRLGPLTPPGSYRATVRTDDGRSREAVLTVRADPRFRVTPGTLRFEGAPGATATAELLMHNDGNVDIDIGAAMVTGVYRNGGVETALASVYRLETDDLQTLATHLVRRLRGAHGGLLRLKATSGSGVLAPGEGRVLRVETLLSRRLESGHAYHGMLRLGGRRVRIAIAVAGARVPDEPNHDETPFDTDPESIR